MQNCKIQHCEITDLKTKAYPKIIVITKTVNVHLNVLIKKHDYPMHNV